MDMNLCLGCEAVPQCGACSQCFPARVKQVKCLYETVWSVKQTRQGFNFGVCLEMVLMAHVGVIFRGAYELSFTLGGRMWSSRMWILNRAPSLSLGPGAWACVYHSPCKFQDPVLKGLFSEKEVGEKAMAAVPISTHLWALLTWVRWGIIFLVPDPGSTLQSDLLLLSSQEMLPPTFLICMLNDLFILDSLI